MLGWLGGCVVLYARAHPFMSCFTYIPHTTQAAIERLDETEAEEEPGF